MDNNDLYNKAKKAIMDLYEDKSVSIEDCISNLEALIDEMEILIDSLNVILE